MENKGTKDINRNKKRKVEVNEKDIKQTPKKRVKKNKKNKKLGRIILVVFLIILIILAGFGIRFAIQVDKNGGGLQGIIATVLGQDENTLANLEPIYCLLMGESTGLTDTIMLCAYNPRTQEASILSIPRDTFYGTNKDTATPYYKINALYSQGPEKTVAAVERILGIEIPYYIVIDTYGVIDMVDLIGGVEFNVPIDMHYTDLTQNLYIDLQEGEQLLDGDKAEQLLRFRHNDDGTSYPPEYGDNDIGRMRTQREFIKAALEQTLKAKNITKINQIIQTLFENIQTNMTFDDIKNYVPYTVNFDLNNLKTGTLPGSPAYLNNYSFFLHSTYETKQMVQELFTFSDEKAENPELGEGVSIEILNGSETPKAATRLEKLLASAGYDIVKTEDTSDIEKTIIINRKENNQEKLDDLNTLVKSKNIQIGETSDDIDFTIIIGKDYSY